MLTWVISHESAHNLYSSKFDARARSRIQQRALAGRGREQSWDRLYPGFVSKPLSFTLAVQQGHGHDHLSSFRDPRGIALTLVFLSGQLPSPLLRISAPPPGSFHIAELSSFRSIDSPEILKAPCYTRNVRCCSSKSCRAITNRQTLLKRRFTYRFANVFVCP